MCNKNWLTRQKYVEMSKPDYIDLVEKLQQASIYYEYQWKCNVTRETCKDLFL